MRFICYTRRAVSEAEYAPRLGLSMHLGYENGGEFLPLNHNYGVLFVKATQDAASGLIFPKSLKKPFVLPVDGGFAVIAIRTEADGGDDESSCGCAVVFWTDDLVHYEELGLLKLADGYLDDVTLKICGCHGGFVAKYSTGGKVYRRRLNGLTEPTDDVKECGHLGREPIDTEIEGAYDAEAFEVPDEKAEYALKKLRTPTVAAVEYDTEVDADKLADFRVTVRYSDGSTHKKRVDWDAPSGGKVTGKIHSDRYEFPIAENRADPCVYRYKGDYYFIATNDADGNRSIFVRRAKTIPGLVTAPEKLILDDRDSWEAPRRVLKKDGTPLFTTGITLDMTTFEDGGRQYAAWSQRQFNPMDLGAWVMIATIDKDEPWKLTSDPVVLTIPEYGWQNNHTLVDEGPFALIRGGKIYLTFSSALVDSTYCVGMMTADCGSDLLDPKSWRKGNYPLLHSLSKPGEYGPGHNAYCEDEWGDVWNTYHARPGVNGPRSSGIRRVHFGFDGEPVLDLLEENDPPEELREICVKIK